VGGLPVIARVLIGLALLVTAAAPAAAATVAWDPNPASDNVTGYLAGYAEVPGTTTVCPTNGDGDTFVPVTPATSTSFTITTLTAGRTYCIRIYAINANGRSIASNTVGPYTASGGGPDPFPTPGAQGTPLIGQRLEQPPSLTQRFNFQPAAAQTPAGFLADTGAIFGPRGNGFTYGWQADVSAFTRDRAGAGQRCDTLVHLQKPEQPDAVWELGVENGTYDVRLVAGDGDAQFIDSVYRLAVEGALLLAGTPTAAAPTVEGIGVVTVTDGRLTVRSAAGAVNNKLCSVEITRR
jgi:hypothetical protein